ncbi:hypothetical protein Taro_007379 [Colocasia esculenta]|uniref:Uncharacterized protein n=1 Tax=Colocasia esculenta TaxID=4460 RepID=A0A843U3N0_COLES|nr:hypothetical protein [Colocasia esculenta]
MYGGFMSIINAVASIPLNNLIILFDSDASLTGAAGKFSGGADIRVFEQAQQSDAKKPSVAAIQGLALGGGLELAMGLASLSNRQSLRSARCGEEFYVQRMDKTSAWA